MSPDTPHDIGAERALIAAVLLDAQQLDVVQRAGVVPESFYRGAHVVLWRACVALVAQGVQPDPLTLQRHLGDKVFADAGGALYLSELIDGASRAANLPFLAGKVVELVGQRRLLAALGDAERAIREHGATQSALAPLTLALAAHEAPHDVSVAAERLVVAEVEKERARRGARRRVDAEERGTVAWPEIETLAARLARPRAPKRWRIRDWHPAGARTMTTAAAKTGKTTLTGNRIRSLVDGDRFLGVAHVTPIAGTYVLLNTEMSADQNDDWLADQGIRDQGRVYPITLKGCAASFNVLDPVCRSEWAARFRERGAAFLDQDGLRPILDALGLDEHKDAGRFLVGWDALLAEAGIAEGNLTHHMGHGQERARGDSRLRDWPDVEIRLMRETDDSRSARFIAAYGRDVDISESRLDYDAATRRLTLAGGSRRDAAARAALDEIIAVLGDREMSGRAIETAVDGAHPQKAVRAALKLASAPGGELTTRPGPHRSTLYTASALVRSSASPVRQRTTDTKCGSASVPLGTTHNAQDGSEPDSEAKCVPDRF